MRGTTTTFAVLILAALPAAAADSGSGLEKAGAASLDVDGKSRDGDKMRGRVTMVQEGGSWKLATEHYRLVFD